MVLRPARWVVAATAVVCLVGLLAAPQANPRWWVAQTVTAFTAALLGRRLHPPKRPDGSALLVVALAIFVVAPVLSLDSVAAALPWTESLRSVFRLIAFGCVGVAVFRLSAVRSSAGDVESRIDASIVTISVLALAYTLLAGADLESAGSLFPPVLVFTLVPLVQAPMTAATARLLFTGAHRSPSAWLFVAAAIGAMVGTIALLTHEGDSTRLGVTLGWWVGSACVGLACLHPSMAELSEPRTDDHDHTSIGRLATIGAALVLLPVLTNYSGGETRAPIYGAVVSVGLVLWRLTRLLRQRDLAAAGLRRHAEREALLAQLGRRAITATDPDDFLEDLTSTLRGALGRDCRVVPATDREHRVATPHEAATAMRFPIIPGELSLEVASPADLTDDDHQLLATAAALATGALGRWRAEASLRHRSLHDALTDLPNRTMLCDRLTEVLGQPNGASTFVVFIDLDGFKQVNDRFGHAAGDTVLREVADRLRTQTRPEDMVARLAGDEFVVVCTSDDPGSVSRIVERIREAITRPIPIPDGMTRLEASIGLTRATPDDDPATILARADAEMYAVKRSRWDAQSPATARVAQSTDPRPAAAAALDGGAGDDSALV